MMFRIFRLSLLTLALPVLLWACGGASSSTDTSAPAPPANKIIGTWAADVRAMMVSSLPEGQAIPPQAEAMLKDSFMTVVFNADGTNTITSKLGGDPENDTGSWKLLSQSGNTYTLELTTRTKAGDDKTATGTAVFSDDDHVKLTVEGGDGPPAMLLTRKK